MGGTLHGAAEGGNVPHLRADERTFIQLDGAHIPSFILNFGRENFFLKMEGKWVVGERGKGTTNLVDGSTTKKRWLAPAIGPTLWQPESACALSSPLYPPPTP